MKKLTELIKKLFKKTRVTPTAIGPCMVVYDDGTTEYFSDEERKERLRKFARAEWEKE